MCPKTKRTYRFIFWQVENKSALKRKLNECSLFIWTSVYIKTPMIKIVIEVYIVTKTILLSELAEKHIKIQIINWAFIDPHTGLDC